MAPVLRNTFLATLSAGVVSGAAVINTRGVGFGDNTWQGYVRSPNTTTVKPQSILSASTTGNVTNPEGLLGGNESPTILNRAQGDNTNIPTVVVDFGQNVVGIVSINFAGSTNGSEGLPGVKLAFSETTQYLTNISDFTRSDNMAAVCLYRVNPCCQLLMK